LSRRVAVVTPTYGDSWREDDLICRRLAAALATAVDVDVLIASGGVERVEQDGGVRLLRLPAVPQRLGRREAVLRALLGPGHESELMFCGCISAKGREVVDALPRLAQEELVRAGGGDSPALWRQLAESRYDVVVFAGYASASTIFGVRHVDQRARVALLPLAHHGLLLRMPIVDHLLERADCILVTTETERSVVERRRVGDAPVWNTGFVLRVNPTVLSAPPHGLVERHHNIVIPGDWRRSRDHRWVERWARAAEAEFGPSVRLRVVGPGATNVFQHGGEHLAGSRLDVWRWISRSVGVIDPHPHRLLGRDVLESMMFGTPVVVPAEGGASREHAQVGNGGLWYRTEAELLAGIGALLDPDTRRDLSEQGRDYATNGFTDTDRYVRSVVKSVLEEE
jgi:glycosyltransferase involved in cell wall biosynthesis